MEAAAEAFLRGGYRGTSMDDIAAAARVSKQTVYQHFSGKERLFAEIITATVGEASQPVIGEIEALAYTQDVATDLRELGGRLLALALRPQVLRLRRLVIAEAARFPDLGRLFLEQGAGRTAQDLTVMFERLAARGVLRLDDPALAASQFNWLIMARLVNRAMLLGLETPPEAAELARSVDDGVRTFLLAYGPRD